MQVKLDANKNMEEQMKGKMSSLIAVVFLMGIQGDLFAQFTSKSIVELNISFEDYRSAFVPSVIQLYGKGKVFEAQIIRTKERYYMSVLPGEYFVYVNLQSGEENRSVLSQMDIFFWFDSESQEMVKEGQMTNQIKIRENCNFILDIVFKTRASPTGFERASEKSFDDFDYCQFFFFTASEMDLNGGEPIVLKHNVDGKRYAGPSSMESALFQDQKQEEKAPAWECTTGKSGEAGENPEDYSIAINKDIIFDEGLISVHLGNFILKNCGYHFNCKKGEGYQGIIGTKTVDPETQKEKWCTAHIPIIDFRPKALDPIIIECVTTMNPLEKKCKMQLSFDIYVKIAVYYWDQNEMCKEIEDFNLDCLDSQGNNPYYLLWEGGLPTVYCPIYYKSVQAHEQCHISKWKMEAEKFAKELSAMKDDELKSFFGDIRSTSCCENDPCTKEDLENIKGLITTPISIKLGDVFSEDEGKKQDPACYRAQTKSFIDALKRKNLNKCKS